MKKTSAKMKIYTTLFVFGTSIYYLLEMIYSGSAHPSTALCGGVSLPFIYFINSKFSEVSIVKKGIICSIFITSCELLCGFFVNIIYKLNVWDYSSYSWNFLGQICFAYSAVWFVLSLACLYLCRLLKKTLE